MLVLLFVKYISDKYAGQPYAPIQVPKGASFADMVALKGNPEIGDLINKNILRKLAEANSLSDMPDFNDSTKLGDGKEKIERLTNLIAIFENPALDFSKNRADGDDLLGDAYEYLMRHFATESGKSKGQFYTPAEVSRVIAQILGIRHAKTTNDTSVYDPTCGSGSLLLKVGDEARHHRDVKVSLYGQEKDNATAGLARMNVVLHDYATADIKQGNTLANPLFTNGDALRTFDYVVANPPFSDKRWSTGLDAENDPWQRFEHFGVPPRKQGDYAYLLHILRSLKPAGKGARILPHGVLFRGNTEGAIRRNLVQRGYIKGIIGLPANLFYGTGIPACIVVLDKEGANARKGIFMIDASKGFIKDGNKNRLREQDIHKIVDTFAKQVDVPRYARLVPVTEISDPKNDYNLNLPRYIDSTEPEDIQDIEGHLRGGIPNRDIDALESYWEIIPAVRSELFSPLRENYSQLAVPQTEIKQTIFGHREFAAFIEKVNGIFCAWKEANTPLLKAFDKGGRPKALIETVADDLLARFRKAPLLDAYDVYPGKTQTETYEDEVKKLFQKEPANMRLLIVVDKLLTGFDAPPCTYLYIDKSMQDHGLFQAICRTNRLDGEDKEFGYIVDYKDLFKKVQGAMSVYTSELDDSAGGASPEVLLQDRLKAGRERLEEAREAIALLCEPVEPPKGELEHIHFFCGNSEIPEDLQEREPRRIALYKSTVAFVRAYSNIADDLPEAGYSNTDIVRLKQELADTLKLREMIRQASGETIDLKSYEADMRHLIDTYIQADAARPISDFGETGLVELIVKSGIADTVNKLPEGLRNNPAAIAETIVHNVRSTIVREQLNDPAFYDKMSALLNEIIADLRGQRINYQEFLKRVAELAKRLVAGQEQDTPEQIGTRGLRALYSNLGQNKELAIRIDEAVKTVRPADWRSTQAKRLVVKQALWNILQNVDEVERIFRIIERYEEY